MTERSAIFCFFHFIISSICERHTVRSCATFVHFVPKHDAKDLSLVSSRSLTCDGDDGDDVDKNGRLTLALV